MERKLTMNGVIHAAVRRDLGRLEQALAGFPAGDSARAGQLERAYGFLQGQLKEHHESEDTLIWPAVRGLGIDGALLDAMESEHHAMSEALVETGAAMRALAATPTEEAAEAALTSVRHTRQVVERHLDHEESELEPALAPHLESAEWKAVEKKLRQHPLKETGPFLAWLQDGMERPVRDTLRGTVPPPVLAVIPALFGRSYNREIAPVWQR